MTAADRGPSGSSTAVPRTIIHLITTLIQGGAERVLTETIPRGPSFGTDGHPERHIVVSLVPGGMFADELREDGADVRDLGMRPGRDLIRGVRNLRALERELRPDCIVGWMYHASLLLLLTAPFRSAPSRGGPRTLWFLQGSLHTTDDLPWHTRLSVRVLARTSRIPDAVAINSRVGLLHHSVSGYRPRRWLLLRNGVDTDRFRPPSDERTALRQQLGIADDAVVLVNVARAHPQKDHSTLLEAFERLARTAAQPLVLLLIGRDTAPMATTTSSGSPVMALGERRDADRLLRAADVIVLSSLTEGLPNALLEGMATGLVPVVTDTGDCREVVADTGRVVPVASPDALAAALADVVGLTADERASLGLMARDRVSRWFSVRRMRTEYRRAWEELCGVPGVVPGPPRILHIIARLNVGGPARIIEGLLAAADGDTADQLVVTGEVGDDEEDWSLLQGGEDSRVVRVPSLRSPIQLIADLRALRDLIRLVRGLRPDSVQTHTAKAGLLGRLAALRAGVPWIVHTYHGHILHGYFSPRVTRMFVAIERILARRTDRLIAVGSRVRDELLAAGIGRAEQYVVIPPGIEDPAPEDRDRARDALGITRDREVITFVGRLTAVKRPDRFIDVARRIDRIRPGVLFLVVGDGELGASLQRAGEAGPPEIRLLGWRGDVANVLAASDVVMLTSDNEGMPVALIEAAFAGRCAIATDVGSVSEVVLDGVTGRVVPTDPRALAEAAVGLLEQPDKRRLMGLAARAHALQRYTRDAMTAATLRAHIPADSPRRRVP